MTRGFGDPHGSPAQLDADLDMHLLAKVHAHQVYVDWMGAQVIVLDVLDQVLALFALHLQVEHAGPVLQREQRVGVRDGGAPVSGCAARFRARGRPKAARLDVVMKDAETERKRRQRKRSLAIAWALVALVVLFFIVTIVRLGGNVASRAM